MRYLRRRLLKELDATSALEKELYEGYDIQFILIDTSDGTPQTLSFSVEINGTQVFNGTLAELRDENALIYGFNDSAENLYVGLLDLKEMLSGNGGINGNIRSIKLKVEASGANNFDVTIGELIDIN